MGRRAFLLGGLFLFLGLCAFGLALKKLRDHPALPYGTKIRTLSQIGFLDLALDGRGRLHLLRGVHGYSQMQVLDYQRSDDGGDHWTTPSEFSVPVGDRIVVCGDDIHVIGNPSYQHAVSRDSGSTWQPADGLGGDGIVAYDGAAWGDTLVVAFLRERRDVQESVEIAKWSGAQLIDSRVLGQFEMPSRTNQHLVSLRTSGGKLQLVATVTCLPAGSVIRFDTQVSTKLVYDESVGSSSAWARLKTVPVDSSIGYSSLALHVLAGAPQIVVSPYFAVVSRKGETWKTTPVSRDSAAGPYDALSACQSGDMTAIAWIDRRYQWDPWSLKGLLANPTDATRFDSYRNNDVFVVVHRGAWTSPQAEFRLTQAPAYASHVCAVMSHKDLFVVWSGRSKVGKSMDAFGAKDQIFFARIPLAGVRAN